MGPGADSPGQRLGLLVEGKGPGVEDKGMGFRAYWVRRGIASLGSRKEKVNKRRINMELGKRRRI